MKKGHILKQKIMDGVKQKIGENSLIILTDTTGLTVDEITRLRRELSQIGGIYQVIKNRLFTKQAKELDLPLSSKITGPTGFLFAKEAPSVCKTLLSFIKRHKRPIIKFGFLDKKPLEKGDIEHLATLPGREALLSSLIAQIQAPISGLVGTLSGILRTFLYTLEAIKDKKHG